MIGIRTASVSSRLLFAAVCALLLALRLLSPAGFMPAFDRGSVTIVACPDAEPALESMPHHHGHAAVHQSCPYAAASSKGFVGADAAPLIPTQLVAFVIAPPEPRSIVLRRLSHLRPFLRGPPLSS